CARGGYSSGWSDPFDYW
nr:immunoglobulin heavy chain junction region [Macaca mulatta]MOX37922.1 immunoglobulin heavy chain junction region [Macaca mulatta]MOX37941.1 immunoglobulin heavy chain junction region [Macaca mulatta]MOX38297.1 immunoglobulin heavy chain junction region [Macaca mulatta]MOX38392.1 immunoglobulin heavy chain junction region [Macaca mulatta]